MNKQHKIETDPQIEQADGYQRGGGGAWELEQSNRPAAVQSQQCKQASLCLSYQNQMALWGHSANSSWGREQEHLVLCGKGHYQFQRLKLQHQRGATSSIGWQSSHFSPGYLGLPMAASISFILPPVPETSSYLPFKVPLKCYFFQEAFLTAPATNELLL